MVVDNTNAAVNAEQFRKLHSALEQSPVSVAITDLNGSIEYVNAEFCRVTGYSREEAFGQNPRLLKSGYHSPEFYDEMWKRIRSGETWRGEMCNRRKNGELYWERTSISPIHDERGQATHFVAVKEDITERKQAEAALVKSQAKLSCALAIAKTGFWEWDLLENRMLRSPETLAIYGLGPEAATVPFESAMEEIHAEDRQFAKNFVAASLQDACERDYQLDFRIVNPLGETRYLSSHGRIVARDNAGHPILVVGTVTDITERKQAETLRQEHERELNRRQAHRMEIVGQLAGGISHEFNNLLQVVLGYTRLAIAESSDETSCRECMQEVLTAAERASRLTQQLLSFSRRRPFVPQNVDPNAAVADMVKLMHPVLGGQIDLEVEFGSGLESVWADPNELGQVLLNLCLNARDAMPAGGRLKVRTDRCVLAEPFPDSRFAVQPGSYVVFTVADTGCGLSDDVRKRMFEPFFTTKEVGKGTGLGLSMVYGVVQEHQGAIRVESELGRGTSFHVYLPAASLENKAKLRTRRNRKAEVACPSTFPRMTTSPATS